MSIDWNAFTPASALLGAMLIGVAAAMFALLMDASRESAVLWVVC